MTKNSFVGSLIVWLSTLSLAIADDSDVIVRTVVEPDSPVSIGQRVVLKVDVLAKDAWSRLVRVPQIPVSGALVFVPPSQNTRLNETIRGDSYSGQRYEWWIYSQREGEMTIPTIDLVIENKIFGDKTVRDPIHQSSEPQSVQVRASRVATSTGAIMASSLDVAQSWSEIQGGVESGDGITRTITREIADAPALLLPPIRFLAPKGARLLPKEASTENRFHRGDLTGIRVDEVTYLFDRPGPVELPKIDITWMNPTKKDIRTESLPGMTIQVVSVAGDASASGIAPSQDMRSLVSRRSWAIAMATLLSFTLGAVAWWYRLRLEAWFLHQLKSRPFSEMSAFHRFRIAARSSNAAEILAALTRWSDICQPAAPAPRLSDLIHRFGGDDASTMVDALMRAVDANEPFHAGELVRHMKRARRAIHVAESSRRTRQSQPVGALPRLR
ncbi:MAG: hypothetical protein AAGJ40_00470 [Planctomycetota bacterium]